MLKPGKCFAGYEWCATEAYNPKDPEQKKVMAEIELGNGLPDVRCVCGFVCGLLVVGLFVGLLRKHGTVGIVVSVS